jgi:transcriptional regulator of heat shock response
LTFLDYLPKFIDNMTKKTTFDPNTDLTHRQRNILFAIVKEYCDHGQSLSSLELKQKYGFDFSPATIRNEMVVLRDKNFLYQPFTNSSSKPTEQSFKLFINQLIVGLQVTSAQQQELRKQILEMEQKQVNLSKEISRLLALSSGGVGFSVNGDGESIAGMSNLLESPGEGKVSDILNFLDNLDQYKRYLLEGNIGTDGEPKNQIIKLNKADEQNIRTIIGGESTILPLGKGYAMIATEVYLDNNEKSVVGLISPIHLLARKKNIELIENISKLFAKNKNTES